MKAQTRNNIVIVSLLLLAFSGILIMAIPYGPKTILVRYAQ
jgi:hypothetical protein